MVCGPASQLGAGGDRDSTHFQDQTAQLADGPTKEELFDWEQIAAAAAEKYQPGQRGK